MVPAGAEEQCSRVIPHHRVQSQCRVVELRRMLEIRNVQMHVADHSARRRAGPRLSARGPNDASEIERVARHPELAAGRVPGAPGAIRIDLDAEAIGITQVQCFAHKMIGRARLLTNAAQMREEASERRAVGKEYRKMIETKPSVMRTSTGARSLGEADEWCVTGLGAEDRRRARVLEHA